MGRQTVCVGNFGRRDGGHSRIIPVTSGVGPNEIRGDFFFPSTSLACLEQLPGSVIPSALASSLLCPAASSTANETASWSPLRTAASLANLSGFSSTSLCTTGCWHAPTCDFPGQFKHGGPWKRVEYFSLKRFGARISSCDGADVGRFRR